MLKRSKFISLFLALSMIFTLVSCNSNEPDWIYKSGESTISPGLYLYYQFLSFDTALGKLKEKVDNGEITDTDNINVKDMFDYTLEDIPVKQWVEENTLKLCKRHIVTSQKSDQPDLALTESEVSQNSQSAKQTYDTNSYLYSQLGIGAESYESAQLQNQIATKLFRQLYGKDGEHAVPDEEVQAFFDENYIYTFSFPVYISGLSGDDLKAREAQIEELIEKLNSGADFMESAREFENAFPESDESLKMIKEETTETEFLNLVPKDKTQTTVPAGVYNAVWNMNSYKTYQRVNADANIIYIVARHDIASNAAHLLIYRDSLVMQMKQDDFNNLIDEMAQEITFEENSTAFKKYNIDETYKRLVKLTSK